MLQKTYSSQKLVFWRLVTMATCANFWSRVIAVHLTKTFSPKTKVLFQHSPKYIFEVPSEIPSVIGQIKQTHLLDLWPKKFHSLIRTRQLIQHCKKLTSARKFRRLMMGCCAILNIERSWQDPAVIEMYLSTTICLKPCPNLKYYLRNVGSIVTSPKGDWDW